MTLVIADGRELAAFVIPFLSRLNRDPPGLGRGISDGGEAIHPFGKLRTPFVAALF